jgi:hypothetical protein
MSRAHLVDHAAPLHDSFCRCRACKPSPVGTTGAALSRIRVAALMLVAVGGLVIIERAAL